MARECRTAVEAAARHARTTRQWLGSYLRRITRHLTGSDHKKGRSHRQEGARDGPLPAPCPTRRQGDAETRRPAGFTSFRVGASRCAWATHRQDALACYGRRETGWPHPPAPSPAELERGWWSVSASRRMARAGEWAGAGRVGRAGRGHGAPRPWERKPDAP